MSKPTQADLIQSLQEAIRYIERVNAFEGAMNADQLQSAERHVRENVGIVGCGRWAGDTVYFDLDNARALVAASHP